jgi:hypothetical protein
MVSSEGSVPTSHNGTTQITMGKSTAVLQTDRLTDRQTDGLTEGKLKSHLTKPGGVYCHIQNQYL